MDMTKRNCGKAIKSDKPLSWQDFADSGLVQEKYLRYSPEDVENINDTETLRQLQEWYFPFSQPRNLFEATYIALVYDAVNTKLNEFCPLLKYI